MYNHKCIIYNNNSEGSRVARARGFMALWGALIMVAVVSALPAAAAPFAYVANRFDNTVSVIDTATKMVVATIPVGNNPSGIAVSPNGKHAYVANSNFSGTGTVSVIDTASNTVVATVPVGNLGALAIAVTPHGTRAYVANGTENILRGNGTVSVIDTASNTVVATITGWGRREGGNATAVAVAPDGQHAYVTTVGVDVASTVSVIDVYPILIGFTDFGVAVTPDGKHAYVTSSMESTVYVIDTASGMLVASVFLPLGNSPSA